MSRPPAGPGRPRRLIRGRRLTDPPDLPAHPGTVAVRGRLAGVSVSASMGAGAWVGFALGLVVGAIVGGGLSWFAGALLDWQRDLAFTFGVARRLLPFGDQLALLRGIESNWYLVIPIVALAVGFLAATVGALLGGILAVAYNRSPRHALVVVELPDQAAAPAVEAMQDPAQEPIRQPSDAPAAPPEVAGTDGPDREGEIGPSPDARGPQPT